MQAEIKYFHDARKGPSRYFKDQRFFACEGLICMIDERPTRTQNGKIVEEGDCVVLTPKEFEKRIKAITRLYRNKTYAEMQKWQGLERKKYHLQAREGYEAVKEAREMGDPSDPAVQAYWARHRGKNYVSFAGTAPDLSKIADTKGAQCDTVMVGNIPATKPLPVQKLLPPMLHLPTPKPVEHHYVTPAEQFKLGFLTRCAEEGLTPEAAQARIAQAEKMLKQSGWPATIATAPITAGLGLVGGAGLAGAGLGYLNRKAELANPIDTEDVQKQELIQAYMLQRRRILDDMRMSQQKNMSLQEGF